MRGRKSGLFAISGAGKKLFALLILFLVAFAVQSSLVGFKGEALLFVAFCDGAEIASANHWVATFCLSLKQSDERLLVYAPS
jgi:hypothetical protein